MTLTQLLPLLTAAGVGATQQEEIMAMIETPINIARVAAVQAELSNIRKLVRLDMITDNLPRNFERQFSDYVRRYMESEGRDTSIDFWGNPYQMEEYDDEFQFWSYGPDGIDDTEDDVWMSLKKQDFTL
jgi:hypothetical protein